MRTTIAITLIIFGCLSMIPTLWFVKEYTSAKTLDYSKEEMMMISDCEKKISGGDYIIDEDINPEVAMSQCVENGWKSIGLILPFFGFGILICGFISLIFYFLGWLVFPKKLPQDSKT